MDFHAMNKPELLSIADRWGFETKGLTAKQIRTELEALNRYDCVKCIWYESNINLAAAGFPVISDKTGNACRQLKTILPVLVTNCGEFLDGTESKSRDARHRQSKRSTNGEQMRLDEF